MWARIVFIAGLLISVASAQEGRFYANQTAYVQGQPTLFTAEISNNTREKLWIDARTGAACVNWYSFDVSFHDANNTRECSAHWDTECGDAATELAPGEKWTVTFPLEHWFRFELLGHYEVQAVRHTQVGSQSVGIKDYQFSSKFSFDVTAASPEFVRQRLQSFESDLQSQDMQTKHVALDSIVTTAPPYMEGLLLRLARDPNPDLRVHAIAGLRILHTPAGAAALSDIVETTKDGEERALALQALGESEDAAYLNVMTRHWGDADLDVQIASMEGAARLGGDMAVQAMQLFVASKGAKTRRNAMYGYRTCACPAAMDAFIDALRDPEESNRRDAAIYLEQMTGHAIRKPGEQLSNEAIEDRWRTWWQQNPTAKLSPAAQYRCVIR